MVLRSQVVFIAWYIINTMAILLCFSLLYFTLLLFSLVMSQGLQHILLCYTITVMLSSTMYPK